MKVEHEEQTVGGSGETGDITLSCGSNLFVCVFNI